MKLNFNWRFIFFLIFEILMISLETNAQICENGFPESFLISQKKAVIIPILKLDSVHVQKMIKTDNTFRIDNRYGVVQQCNINIKDLGIKTEIDGKGTIWRYKIESNDAYSLGIFFKTYHLPSKAKVFIYNSSQTRIKGAFTKKNNNSGNQLPVAEFSGKDLVIEYFEPTAPEFSGDLILGSVSQSYSNFTIATIDRIGINCPQGNDWQMQKNSICLMTFHDSHYSYFCTGTLLNNVKEDGTPYFLTANHCINSEAEANTLVTYFNYENSSCDANDASISQSLAGASFKSGNNYSDFSLLLLNEYPPDEYNPYYAGWDASGTIPLSGVCIHHPKGEPKCLSIDSLPLESYNGKLQWIEAFGQFFITTADSHWSVQFGQGSPEAGSSGSPFFDQNHRIIGQLHGGNDFMLVYGKFSLSWNRKLSSSEQLACWLDPENTTKTLDGIWKIPPKAGFRTEMQQVCVNNPILFHDESTQNPSSWFWQAEPSTYSFVNGTDSTSQNPQILFLKDGNYSVTLHTSNKYGNDKLTQQNYILAQSDLDVRFLQTGNEIQVCGCDLKAFPLRVKGAFAYNFEIDKTEMIDIKSSSGTLFLTLNDSIEITKSFDTWVKVVGKNGFCAGSDSLLLHVIIQPNDNIANAAWLYPGRNTGYSNKCATVEKLEPIPMSTGCYNQNSWCPDYLDRLSKLDNSIWFTFISPSSGWITINTNGFDDQIAVYKASSCSSIVTGSSGNFAILAANDDRSNTDNTAWIENLILESGKQYWLQVDGNNAVTGNLVIDLLSSSIEVYPNPSKGIFNLIISNLYSGIAFVTVSDLNGRRLFDNQYHVYIDLNKFELDLSVFPKGIYLLNVRMNETNLSKKLLIF